MKQNPERPRSGSRPAQPVLGRFAVEPRLPAPLNDDGVCAPLLLAGGVGRNGDVDGGNEVLLGPWALRLVGSPPKNPAPSRSSWNMSTNSCCSSSKLSCTEYTDGLGQRTDLDARGALQIDLGQRVRVRALPLAWPGSSCRPSLRGSRPSPTAADGKVWYG